MLRRYLPVMLIAVFLLHIGFEIAVNLSRLPAQVASHFNAGGQPDDFVSRPAFVVLILAVAVVPVLIIGLMALVLPRVPRSLVNLPHKEYWLAEERRAETMRYGRRWLAWFAAAVAALMAVMVHLGIEANLRAPVRLSGMCWVFLGAFLVFTGLWIMRLYRHFRVPAQD